MAPLKVGQLVDQTVANSVLHLVFCWAELRAPTTVVNWVVYLVD